MVFFVFLHMMRVFYHGAYQPPREDHFGGRFFAHSPV